MLESILEFSYYTFLCIIPALAALKIYIKATTGVCKSKRRIDGKTAIITGANTGIGKETALDLAFRGARVILACRNLDRANAAKDEIIYKTGNRNVIVRHLDLASLKSVRAFANDILKSEGRLDILINNAGVAGLERKMTEDGLEYQMQSNHFGHFLLTNMLLGLMKKTTNARVISVSSIAHALPKSLDLENLNGEKMGDPQNIYYMNKLCNVLFINELAKMTEGLGITANSLHPGVIETEIFRNAPTYLRVPMLAIIRLFFKTVKEGAQTTIHLAVSEEVEGVTGKYFSDCKEKQASSVARDEGLAKKLWEKSEELVKIQPSERHI